MLETQCVLPARYLKRSSENLCAHKLRHLVGCTLEVALDAIVLFGIGGCALGGKGSSGCLYASDRSAVSTETTK